MVATYEWARLWAYASAQANADVYRSASLFVGAGMSSALNELRVYLQFGQAC
ncbi:hypothetical protein O4G98_07095 [Zoogloeaceae bacterium G21618-S1]|nr:hypothetical protein [Zoogloeaceae bacterium G21618-S1]